MKKLKSSIIFKNALKQKKRHVGENLHGEKGERRVVMKSFKLSKSLI